MSLSAQFQALNKQAAAFRKDIFSPRNENGDPILLDYDNGTLLEGYFTPIRNQQQLDDAGMHGQHDTIVRISRSSFSSSSFPQLGRTIRLPLPGDKSQLVQIAEFGNHGVGPEWVLGCKAL